MSKTTVVLNRIYPQPVEVVWGALTEPQAMAEWLMPVEGFELNLHQRFQFQTKPGPGFDGKVYCEIVEIERFRRLAYTWQGGPMKHPTLVTWTLKTIEQGTLLTLEQAGFRGLGGMLARFILGRGWKNTVLPKLGAYLSTSA